MRYMKMKRVIVLVALLSVAGGAGFGRADHSPSNEAIAFAQRTSDLLLNELLAALFTEFNETTPENVEEGKQAISLIFNDANRDMRLIGVFPPLQGGLNDLPSDSFERRSLALALKGQAEHVRRARGRSLVLSPLGRAQQHLPPGLRSLPYELHQRVLQQDE